MCYFFAYFFDGIKIYDTHFYKYYFNVPFLKAGIIIESLYVYICNHCLVVLESSIMVARSY